MGNCIYCGKPAGFLRKIHKECRHSHNEAAIKIPEFFVEALASAMESAHFKTMIEEIARQRYVGLTELRQLEISGLQKMIMFASSGGMELTQEKEQRIVQLSNAFGITANELGDSGLRLAKTQILRRLDEGKYPENIQMGELPIIMEHDEKPIWLYNNVAYFKPRKKTRYVGGSQGISIRVMRGVYYRVGSYRGEPIQTQYLAEEGKGVLLLTSRNVYFWSPQKAIKLPIRKILAMQPYADGIQIMRDAANAVPNYFELDDPLFACDAISRLNRA